MQAGKRSAAVGLSALAVLALLSLGPVCGGGGLAIPVPQEGQLSLAGDVAARIQLPLDADLGTLQVMLDGADVTGQLPVGGGEAQGTLAGVAPGWHELHAQVSTPSGVVSEIRHFETVELENPGGCETLNGAHCLLPYPSDWFRRDGGSGQQLVFPQDGIPQQNRHEIDAAIFLARDGFSPTAQVLVNFPAGVDLEASGAPRLLAEPSRSTDGTSLSPQSPTLLLDEAGGARILHWLENDVRALDPAAQILFLRPGRSLTPGKRYIVAFRNLVDGAGQPIEAEPVFAALRDGRPTDIPEVEARRADFERIFQRLGEAGFARASLQLAFDFTVASDENLTGQMLSMRDQALAWLAAQDQTTSPTFSVDSVVERDCSQPGERIWREVRGRFEVPLFLSMDPETDPIPPSFLVVGPDGFTPEWSVLTYPEYGISIPCAAQEDPATTRVHPVVAGHGLFGNGPSFAIDIARGLGDAADGLGLASSHIITGATHWRGLSTRDYRNPTQGQSFIVHSIVTALWNIPALPDRLRQGVLNQLVLARMMKSGAFNAHPAFQAPASHGVFRPGEEGYYFGASLGGIMGLMFSALTPDVIKHNVDVPAINFGLLLQRATPFIQFQFILDISVGNEDPVTQAMVQAIGLSLLHEIWVTGESAGYATHITKNPLPGTPRKQVLMTMAWLDQQVSNQATEIAARTLNLPSLEGSLLSGLRQIPDVAGPLGSAFVVYDTGSFDLADPAHEPFIPPLANLPAEPNGCDPHGRRALIPASLRQLSEFFKPGGTIENFCDGLCDADASIVEMGPAGNDYRLEIPNGDPAPCMP
jgi:hypothetical protein